MDEKHLGQLLLTGVPGPELDADTARRFRALHYGIARVKISLRYLKDRLLGRIKPRMIQPPAPAPMAAVTAPDLSASNS